MKPDLVIAIVISVLLFLGVGGATYLELKYAPR